MNEIYFSVITNDEMLKNFTFNVDETFYSKSISNLPEEKFIYLKDRDTFIDNNCIYLNNIYKQDINENFITLNNKTSEIDNIFSIFENENVNISI